ncbi:hypothetical protein ACHQM5_011621 [Ranunculus cassubicifolius]
MTKYALTITPVALSLEELLPASKQKSHLVSGLIRTLLVFSTLVVALTVPFFGLVMALIGSFSTMLVAISARNTTNRSNVEMPNGSDRHSLAQTRHMIVVEKNLASDDDVGRTEAYIVMLSKNVNQTMEKLLKCKNI